MTSNQISKAKEVTILSVMKHNGFDTKRYGGLYLAPWRKESKGSLKIFPVTTKGEKCRWHEEWFDFGERKGGTVIDFVMRLNESNFDDAVKWLLKMQNVQCPESEDNKPTGESGFDIKKIGKITNADLRQYAHERCVADCILDEYCVQVDYSPRNYPNWTFRAIGFKNDSGQYELNGYSYKTGRKFKGITSAPKDITSLLCGSSKLLIFEGFFNLLSLFSMPEWLKFRHDYDIIILNSVSNVNKALTKLSNRKYDKVGFMLDEDDAGIEAREILERSVTANEKRNLFKEMFFDLNRDFCDEYSRTHDGHVADLNDIWIHTCKERGIKC